MPIVDDDCGSIVNCLALKFMLMNFHIDLSIQCASVCVWLIDAVSQPCKPPQKEKREIITGKNTKNII